MYVFFVLISDHWLSKQMFLSCSVANVSRCSINVSAVHCQITLSYSVSSFMLSCSVLC